MNMQPMPGTLRTYSFPPAATAEGQPEPDARALGAELFERPEHLLRLALGQSPALVLHLDQDAIDLGMCGDVGMCLSEDVPLGGIYFGAAAPGYRTKAQYRHHAPATRRCHPCDASSWHRCCLARY